LDTDRKFRIGYIRDSIESEGLQPEIKEAMLDVVERLKAEGHEVEAVDFHHLDYIVPTYYILTTAEASSNLSRFDGVKYGYRSPDATDLVSMYKKTRSQGFGHEVQKRIMLGTFVLSADYYDAYYTKAQRVRRVIKEKTEELLHHYDFLIQPTTPTTAFPLGGNDAEPLALYLADIFTVQASLAGVPAISVPAGYDDKGLSIGLQILARPFAEEQLLAFSKLVNEKIITV
jgi:aspartyl-tRNA(Asn)/glutamyl-tRNA(Gln) amidotransferase subunit A